MQEKALLVDGKYKRRLLGAVTDHHRHSFQEASFFMMNVPIDKQIIQLLEEWENKSQYTNIYLFADKWAKRIYKLMATAPKDSLVAGQKRENI